MRWTREVATRTALLMLSLATVSRPALAERVSVEQADAEQKRAAQKTFEAGDELYESGRYDEALTAFRASHALVASPNSRLMVARCLRELGRIDSAFSELEATVADAAGSGGRYAETAAAARAELAALREGLAFVVVETPADAGFVEFSIGERRFTREAFERPIAVTPGSVAIVLYRENGERTPLQVELAAGETRSAELMPRSPTAPLMAPSLARAGAVRREPRSADGAGAVPFARTTAWVAGGVGIAGLVGFAVFGALNEASYSKLDRECPDGRCLAERQNDIDAGRRYQTLANVSLATFAVGAATSVTLFLISPSKDSSAGELSASVGVSSVHVRTRF